MDGRAALHVRLAARLSGVGSFTLDAGTEVVQATMARRGSIFSR